MKLTDHILSLRVARYNDEPLLEPFAIEFGAQGGTIGRATDCTLVLPDQHRAISRVQARIVFRVGEYLLCDVGGNPSLLNQQAIGGTREARLADGDRLQIGAYQLEVAVGERAAGALGASGLRDPLAAAKVLGGPLPGGGADSGGFGTGLLDPLGQPEFGQPTPVSTRPAFEGSQSDHVPPEFEAFAVPVPAGGAPLPSLPSSFSSAPSYSSSAGGGIPADYDPLADALAQWDAHGGPTGLPSSLSEGPMAGGAATPFDELFALTQLASRASQAQPESQVQRQHPEPLPSFDAPVQRQPEPVSQPQSLPEWQPSSRDAGSTPRSQTYAGTPGVSVSSAVLFASTASTTPPSSPASSASLDAVLAALIAGLGLDPSRAPNLPAPEFALLVGAMLREALRGTMAVLRARSTTKREARLDTTVIVARDNNPLKFFPDVDSALAQMMTGRSAGYLPPEQALAQAFVDIASHELAVIAGMRAALSNVLTRFDPAALEAQLAEQGVMDKILSNRKAKLWDRFVAMQAQIARENDDDFQKLFGKAFNDAYEAQIDALRAARQPASPDPANHD
ncbi:hypothetical protein WL13_27320 [Burkholderia ubonensis]|nr:hypothetical protein WL13_27320 [Burkholderia ubonensis]KWB18548.1 hypothetical protein WL33_06600 [Burkholderia ubonensis]